MWERNPGQRFKAWVIGGSDQDKCWAEHSARSRPALQSRLHDDLLFWGRVDSSALPEFYSRSTALIVPSFREQFCIAAVEAMMCGCPVIAARVGGLQSVVVDGLTGNLFERGLPTSLAAVMNSYIHAPSLPSWLGRNAAEWSRRVFDAGMIYPLLEKLLQNVDELDCRRWHHPAHAQFHSMSIQGALPTLERLLGSEVESFEDLTSSQSTSFKARLKDGAEVFVKIYSDRPTFLSCLHPLPLPGNPSELPRERLLMALRLQGQAFFPRTLAYDLDAGLIVQECANPIGQRPFDDIREKMRRVICLMQSFDPLDGQYLLIEATREKLAEASARNGLKLAEIDMLVAELHAPLVGGSLRSRRFHPQVELFRIMEFLENHASLLPKDYVIRTRAAASLLLSMKPLVAMSPTFAHGTLKVEHFLIKDDLLLLCDFDHAGFFCGPVDISHCIWDFYLHSNPNHPRAMLKCLREELAGDEEFYLGLCWTLAFQLNRDLAFISRGDFDKARKTCSFLYEFPEAVRDALATH